jgi:hypothetical protein
MDDLERMYRHLVRTLRASFAPYLTQPFEVGELYQTILPYRLHRKELGLDTNQDYELTMLELLSGARGYLVVDDKMRDALSAAHALPTPDPTVIRDFASAHVALAPEPLQRLDTEGRGSGVQPQLSATGTQPAAAPFRASGSSGVASNAYPNRSSAQMATPAAGAPIESARRAARPITVAAAGETCLFCKGSLPAGRQLSFCPHCGQDLTMVHCPACGSELERGWKFCVTCGRSAQDL